MFFQGSAETKIVSDTCVTCGPLPLLYLLDEQ